MISAPAALKFFEVEVANLSTIQGIGKVRIERFHVEVVCPATNFFVRSKANANGAVGNFGMVDKIFDGSHDFGNTGFIISAEEG